MRTRSVLQILVNLPNDSPMKMREMSTEKLSSVNLCGCCKNFFIIFCFECCFGFCSFLGFGSLFFHLVFDIVCGF